MIKINLLPKHLIVPEKTPLPRFMLILASAAAGVAIVFYVALLFIRIKTRDNELRTKQKELNDLKADVAKYEAAQKDLTDSQAKVKEMGSVLARTPVDWWKTLDTIWAVIHRHKGIWIDEISYVDGQAIQGIVRRTDASARTFPEFGVQIKCHAAGTNASEVTSFRMDLKNDTTLQAIVPNANFNPDWKVSDEKEYEEGFSMGFEVVMLAAVAGQAPLPKPVIPGSQPPKQ